MSLLVTTNCCCSLDYCCLVFFLFFCLVCNSQILKELKNSPLHVFKMLHQPASAMDNPSRVVVSVWVFWTEAIANTLGWRVILRAVRSIRQRVVNKGKWSVLPCSGERVKKTQSNNGHRQQDFQSPKQISY